MTLTCRFCGWKTPAKDIKVGEGAWKRLRSHVFKQHRDEYLEILRSLRTLKGGRINDDV